MLFFLRSFPFLLLTMATEPSNPSPQTLPSSHFHLTTLKLTPKNYLMWKVQISTYLKGQDLYSYIDGTQPPLPKMISAKKPPTQKINPTYLSRHRVDQVILSIIFSSLTKFVIGYVIFVGTFRGLWLTFETLFNSHF